MNASATPIRQTRDLVLARRLRIWVTVAVIAAFILAVFIYVTQKPLDNTWNVQVDSDVPVSIRFTDPQPFTVLRLDEVSQTLNPRPGEPPTFYQVRFEAPAGHSRWLLTGHYAAYDVSSTEPATVMVTKNDEALLKALAIFLVSMMICGLGMMTISKRSLSQAFELMIHDLDG